MLLGVAALGLAAVPGGHSAAADEARVYVVQGLPGRTLDVAIDGHVVGRGIRTAAVAGPFAVKAGSREVTFRDGEEVVLARTFRVQPGSSWDVVVHLPDASGGDPAVTVFRNDTSAVPRGKASLTVAHTARVGKADIRVDGRVLFRDIGNGQSLNLVVPVRTYTVAIVPAGKAAPVILGPVKLTVTGGALNRVYAIGDPSRGTMNVAVHVIDTGRRGSARPERVDTGTGGQAAGQRPAGLPAEPALWR